VTSLAGLATELASVAVFAAYAAGSGAASHATLFAAFAVLYLPVAVAMARRARGRAPAPEDAGRGADVVG
jgi:hypothetical protein